jgi:hypothetical protein
VFKVRVRHLALVACLVCIGAPAAAQSEGDPSTETPAPTPGPTTSPDVVRKADGGILRGSIIELVPSQKVVIQLPTGDMREVSMDEVDYAGPADEMPSRRAPAETGASEPTEPTEPTDTEPPPEEPPLAQPVTVQKEMAQLTLRADEPGLTYYIYHGATGGAVGPNAVVILHSFDRLCTAPCKANLPAGSYRFALSREADEPTEARPSIDLSAGPSTLDGRFVSRRGTRIAGWILLSVAAVAFGATTALAMTGSSIPLSATMGTALAGGAFTGAGVFMVLRRDTARVDHTPGR